MDHPVSTCASTSSTDSARLVDRAGGLLLHPTALVAMALLWTNDHVWKLSHPGVVTGKLSDFAGLVVFPLFVAGAIELAMLVLRRPVLLGPRPVAVIAGVVGLVFTAIQLDSSAASAYEAALALRYALVGKVLSVGHTMDPTDLAALPMLLVPVWLANMRQSFRLARTHLALMKPAPAERCPMKRSQVELSSDSLVRYRPRGPVPR